MAQPNQTSAIPSHVYNSRESNSPASETSGVGDNNGYPVAACSPAPSNSSLFSEQEPIEQGNRSRQSPFHAICQASPSSSYSAHAFTRPDFLNLPTSIPDSETSSRSSADGISLSKQTFRGRRRKNSSDSSGSEGSNFTVGGESVEGDDTGSRKSSRTKLPDDLPPVVKAASGARNRLDKIRRESSCSIETEVAHERLVRNSQQVSQGFDEFCIDTEHRKRLPSVTGVVDPISVVTNSLLPHSCSPSPTRHNDVHKQCYSPSTQLIVRNNISYSPSRSPTSSPTRNRLLRSVEVPRSLSPIATRGTLKRRYTASGVGEDYEIKRSMVKACTSPLVTDRAFPYPPAGGGFPGPQELFAQPLPSSSNSPNPFSVRRPSLSLVDSEFRRRTSVDSTSDDQKSFRDDISEPSSVQRLDESMEVDCSSQNEQKALEPSELPVMVSEESDSCEKMEKDDYEVYREFIEEPKTTLKESLNQLPTIHNHVNPVHSVATMSSTDLEIALNAPLPSDDEEL